MKRLILILMFLPIAGSAQVGIGTTSPHATARLQVDANASGDAKGFLPPRVALAATNSTTPFSATPATGLLVYNTATAGTAPNNVTPGFYYYDGVRWQRVINTQDATVTFDGTNPSSGTNFTGGPAASTNYIYVSNTDNSQWTYNGTSYVTYTPPPSTPWYNSGGTTDAGSNKTGVVYRTGRVGIGTTTAPDASAQLDVNSTSKGFLPPRVSLTSTTAAGPISSPATGLMVYNIATAGSSPNNVVPGYYYNSGTTSSPVWKRLAPVEVDNTFKLVSTGTALNVNTSQDLVWGSWITLNNTRLQVIVPGGFSSNRIILQWNLWGDVNSTNQAYGSLRFQISQSSPTSNTVGSVMMTSWNIVPSAGGQARWAAPVGYILENVSAGSYTFDLQVKRETEGGNITSYKMWGVAANAQVFVQ